MRDFFKKFSKSEDGATLVEYGVALLVAIIVGGVALTNLATTTSENVVASCGAVAAAPNVSYTVC
jgi:Flp pilus assembly pilin Flp